MGIDAALFAKKAKKWIWLGRSYHVERYDHEHIDYAEKSDCDYICSNLVHSLSEISGKDAIKLFVNCAKYHEDDANVKQGDSFYRPIIEFIKNIDRTDETFFFRTDVSDDTGKNMCDFTDDVTQKDLVVMADLGKEAYAYSEIDESYDMTKLRIKFKWEESPNNCNVHSCNHTWASYHGLFEQYEYCTKCDTKKNESTF